MKHLGDHEGADWLKMVWIVSKVNQEKGSRLMVEAFGQRDRDG